MTGIRRERPGRLSVIRCAIIAMLLPCFAVASPQAKLPDGMAVRSVFNGGKESLTKFCSASESNLIKRTIEDALYSLRNRNLRQLGSGYGECEDHCLGMDPFTCYWYTETACGSFRRGLSAEDDEGVVERLLLKGEEELLHQCNKVKSAVLSTLVKDLESLEDTCESLVLSTLELKCYFKAQ